MGTKSQGVMGTTGINAFNSHSDIEYVCVWGGGCIMGATGTNVFLYEITIFHGYQWVPMGTKSQGVISTTGINAFNFHSDIEYVCVCGAGGGV